MIQLEQNGEPIFSFTSPVIYISKIQHTVELGTFVSYYRNDRLEYGQIISSFSANGSVCVKVKKYIMRSDVEEQMVSSVGLLPSPLTNRFISIEDIFRTRTFFDVFPDHLNGIIFVRRTEDILYEGYKESKNVFCLQYEKNERNTFMPIPQDICLSFLCSYKTFPPLYRSYAFKIHKHMQVLKEAVLRMMCRSSEKK